MSTVLVAGGTSSLSCEVVSRLLSTPHQVRMLSHQTPTEAPSAAQVLAAGTGLPLRVEEEKRSG